MEKNIQTQVFSVIADALIVDISKVVPTAVIANDLKADSLDMVNLSLALQDHFDINIKEAELETIVVVDDVVKKVVKELSKKKDSSQDDVAVLIPGNKRFIHNAIITLDDTNAEGNVYFNEINALMGKARDYFALEVIPGFAKDVGKLYFLATAETHGYYKKNLYFGDSVEVQVFVNNILPASVELYFEIYNQEKNMCAHGSHIISFMSIDGQLQEFPQEFKSILYKYYKE